MAGPDAPRRAGRRPGAAVLELDVRPPGPYRLPRAGRDGVMRRRGGALVRLLHVDDEPALVHAWPLSAAVRLRVEAPSRATAACAAERMRFALGVDHDLRPFQRRFARDPLLGPAIRRRPWLRPWRTAEPFHALAWAICEQLIEWQRATAIERRLVWRYGRASDCGRLRDAPSAAALAGRAPAELEACGLTGARALALRRAASAAARGHLDLESADGHDAAWRRLRTIPAIGAWTCEKLAFHGQGRDDRLPAADLAYLKLVGHLAGLGRRASEEEVRTFFAPYDEHASLAGIYLLAGSHGASAAAGGQRPSSTRWGPGGGSSTRTRPSPEELVEKAAGAPFGRG